MNQPANKVDLRELLKELSAKHGRDRVAKWLQVCESKGYVDKVKVVKFLRAASAGDWYK